MTAWQLGAGRARRGDAVCAAAGVTLRQQRGAQIRAGDVLAVLHADDGSRIPAAVGTLSAAFTIGSTAAAVPPLVLERVGQDSGP
jgi:thymidine phosphorylase